MLRTIVDRRLPQVAGIYLGAGWGLLEFTDWAVDHFGIAPALTDAFVLVWAACLPLALLVAWRRPPSTAVADTPIEPADRSVAVLPFVNLSNNADDTYLSDGITEEVISRLSRLELLRVASRTSAYAYKGFQQDVRKIGRELNVRAVLEGSVQHAGNRLRVATQLINVADGYHLWSERFDSEFHDVFAIEDQIAERVARALSVILKDEDRRMLAPGRCCDPRAYELYLRARQFFRQMRKKSLYFARELFRRAIEIDDAYALAHAGLADANSVLRMYYPLGEADMEEAERASRRALELDSQLAEAHSARGAVHFLLGRTAEAEAEFGVAIRMAPRLFEARYLYARMCFQLGRLDDAARLFEEAFAAEQSHEAAFFLAQTLEAMGREQEAADAYQRSLAVTERHMELNPDDSRAATIRAVSLCRSGRIAEGVEWAERAIAIEPDDAGVRYNVACLFSVAGEIERAFACLQSAVHAGFGNRQWLEHDPDLTALRADPRFAQLLDAMPDPSSLTLATQTG